MQYWNCDTDATYIPHIDVATAQAFPDIGSLPTKRPTGQSLGCSRPAASGPDGRDRPSASPAEPQFHSQKLPDLGQFPLEPCCAFDPLRGFGPRPHRSLVRPAGNADTGQVD